MKIEQDLKADMFGANFQYSTMHNYMKKIQQMIQDGRITADAGWCAINSNGECNCDPDIKVIGMPAPKVWYTAEVREAQLCGGMHK